MRIDLSSWNGNPFGRLLYDELSLECDGSFLTRLSLNVRCLVYVKSFSELHDVVKRSSVSSRPTSSTRSTIVDTSLWATAVAVA